jgi:cytoskeleton protein RodZ
MNDSADGNNNQHFTGSPVTAPGAQLAAYREERGWTIEQVASQLNLAPRQIVAIESDDYASLPGMPIVRGFVRAYAKLLKIDATSLLAAIGGETAFAHQQIAPRKALSAPFSETRLPSMMDRPGFSSKWLLGLLIVVLLGVAFWATRQNGELEDLSKSASSQVKDGIAYLSESSGPKAETKTDASAPDAMPPAPEASTHEMIQENKSAQVAAASSPAEAATSASAQAVSPQAVPAPAAAAPTAPGIPVAAPSASTKSVAAPVTQSKDTPPATPGKDALVFTVRQDSWIEVRRAGSNSVLLSRVVKAGSSETVDVTEPVSVVVGNAAGVDASLRGTPVEFNAASGNVARLNLK